MNLGRVQLKKFRREWFYTIDHKGMLFLEETEPKNYTSCLKDDNFLNFFFKNLKPNDVDQELSQEGFAYISKCWGEINYVKLHESISTPIVFRFIEDL